MPHRALFVDIPLALFDGRALVVTLLTLGQGELTFHQMVLPVNFCADTGVSFLLDG